MDLEKRILEAEKRVATLEVQAQEQPKSEKIGCIDLLDSTTLYPANAEIQKKCNSELSVKRTLDNKGIIYFSGAESLSNDEKNNLIKDLETVIKKYTDKHYGLHLILQ